MCPPCDSATLRNSGGAGRKGRAVWMSAVVVSTRSLPRDSSRLLASYSPRSTWEYLLCLTSACSFCSVPPRPLLAVTPKGERCAPRPLRRALPDWVGAGREGRSRGERKGRDSARRGTWEGATAREIRAASLRCSSPRRLELGRSTPWYRLCPRAVRWASLARCQLFGALDGPGSSVCL